MTTPADLQALINAIPWANTTGLISGVDEQALWNACVAVLEAEGGTVWPTVGAPSSGLGNNGDYAIDQTNRLIYGPKAAGAWPTGTSFSGSPGGSSGQLQYNNAGSFGGYGIGSGLSVVGGSLTAVGGTGLISVTSIAALQALTTSTGAVAYLDAGGLSGPFAWSSANLSTQVTNDPGKGITVPPASDTTGASGAWVRQYTGKVNITWWGAIADGVVVSPTPFGSPTSITSTTDNATALNNFGVWARAESAAGRPVVVEVTPPLAPFNAYCFNHANCQWFLCNIKTLRWYNNGSLWQNTYSGAANFANSGPWAFLSSPLREGGTNVLQSWFINTTTQGAYAFSTVTSTDVANVAVGDWISLASLDVEYFGFPPTPQQFEFVKASAVNQYASAAVSVPPTYTSGTGQLVLTFATAPFGASIGRLYNGVAIAISAITGGAVNGTWPIVSTASAGTVITLAVTKGLGSLTLSGGTLAAMGIVTIEQAIRNQHRVDFPDSTPNNAPVGRARVWQLNIGGFTVNGVANTTLSWDLDHKYIDMNVGCPPNVTSGTLTGHSYWTMSGRKIETENWVGPGFSESIAGHIFHTNPTVLYTGEPDKWVEFIQYLNINHYNGGVAPFAPSGPLGFQSPIERVNMIGGRINGGLTTGQVKNFHCQLVDIDSLALFNTFGLVNRHVFDTCRIGNSDVGLSPLALSAIDGATLATFDGVDAAYGSTTVTITIASPGVVTLSGGTGQPTVAPANGTIVILSTTGALPTGYTAATQYFIVNASGATFQLAATLGGSAINTSGSQSGTQMAGFGATSGTGVIVVNKSTFPFGFAIGLWNAVPGMTVNLTGPAALLTGASSNQVNGNGVVTAISEDATYYYISTTLNFATLPAWSNGKIYLFHNQGATFKDCTGSDVVRQASDASKKGFDYWEYKKYTFGGIVSSALSFVSQIYGALIQVTCTVLEPGANANATIRLTFNTFNSASNFATDSGGTVINFVVGLWGQRIVNLAGFTGGQTGDSLAFNGGSASQQALPPGRVVGPNISIAAINFAGTAVGNPVAIIELQFDTGIIRKVVPVQFDNSGSQNTVFGVTGKLP